MATDLNTMLWFGVFGVLFVLVYKIIHGVMKAGSSVFGESEKSKIKREVRKEVEKEKEKKKYKN